MKCPRRRRPTAIRPVAEPLEGRAYFAVGLTFGKAATFPTGTFPDAIAAVDMNGDGVADIVTADYGSGTVSVLMGQFNVVNGVDVGNGTFAKPVPYPVGASPQSLVVTDLNHDGHPDVVVVGNGSDYVFVLMNNGDGTLAPARSYAVGLTASAAKPSLRPEGVAVADVNRDGFPDIVTANQGVVGKGSIGVLLGNGDGTFQPVLPYDGGPDPDALAVGDLNEDGFPDVVTVDPENDELHVLFNKGDGTFPATTTDYSTDLTGRAVAIVDVNNDARPDLVVANLRAASVGVLLNNGDDTSGDDTFSNQNTYRVGGFPFSILSADLNGDNRAELITADSRDDAVGVLVHNGEGAFNVGGGTGATNDHTDRPRQFPTGESPEGVAVADVNGDGKPDLITADFNDSQIGVLLNQTVFQPLTVTALTLAASQNPIAEKSPLTLTATVSPAPTTAFPAGRVVQFLDGTEVLGVAKLTAAGTATVTTTKLVAGTASIVARYGGNAHYAGSVATIDEVVQSAADASPLVAATAVAVTSRAGRVGAGTTVLPTLTLPADPTTLVAPTTTGPLVVPSAVVLIAQSTTPFVPGDAGAVAVTITNYGMARATGYVAVALSLVPTDGVSPAIPLTAIGSATFGIDVRSGHGFVVPVRFQLPTTLAAGGYTVAAVLSRARATFTTEQVSGVATTTAAPVSVVSVLVPFVPGDSGSVAVTIANQGAGRATGAVAVSLSVAPSDDPTAAVPVAVVGSDTFAVNLLGGTSRVVTVPFTVPASLAAGEYTISAALAASTGLAAADVSPAAVATASPTTVVTAFGQVPSGRRQPTLTTALPSGSVVTFTLTGPGVCTLTETPVTTDGVVTYRTDLTLAHTSAATTLSISSGGVPVAINTFSDNYRLGALLAPDVTLTGLSAIDLTGSIALATGITQLTLAGVNDSNINIGPLGHAALSLGTVTSTALSAVSVFQSLTVNSWSQTAGDAIVAPGIRGALTSAGDFGPRLSLSGVRAPVALGSASIGGTLNSPTWLIGTNVGAITAGSVAAGFSGSIARSVASLTVNGDFAGVLAAKSFGDVVIAGNLTDGDILAGTALGPAAQLGGGDDTFNVGQIASVQVGGNVTGSLVAAGLKPASDAPFTPAGGTLLVGGAIGPTVVKGTVDAASHFAAAALPATASIAGAIVQTSSGSPFSTDGNPTG